MPPASVDLAAPALSGFLLGLGLIVSIGAQNAFVLQRGLRRDHVFAVCLTCALSDALLITTGVAGLGTLIASRPEPIVVVTLAGTLFLGSYALIALRRALRPAGLDARTGRRLGLYPALLTTLGVTFLNPHVYLDTVFLLGSLSSRYGTGAERTAYGTGATAASVVWFFALGYGARLLAPVFARPSAWRILDAAIAIVMAVLALGLVASLF